MKLNKLNLQYFADEPVEPDVETPTDAGPENKPADNPEEQPSKTFTQDELNDIIAKRIAREKEKQAEYESQLTRLKELEQAEEERKKAEMSEVERLQAEREEAAKKAQEAQELATKAQETANKRIIASEIRGAAMALNANDANDVLSLIDKSSIEITDDGEVKGVSEAISALKTSKPWLFKAPIGSDASGGSHPRTNPPADEISAKEKELEQLKQDAVRNPRLAGKITKLYNEIIDLKHKR